MVEQVAEAAVSSSRFKRRSRTTYTKHQVSIVQFKMRICIIKI